jgi:hypothetical protein
MPASPCACASSTTPARHAGGRDTRSTADDAAQRASRPRPGPVLLRAPVPLLRRAQPHRGVPPPAHPRLRKRWFEHVRSHTAALWRGSSRGLSNPRRGKRRNTSDASHARTVPRNQPQTFTPALLPPLPLSKRKGYSQAKKLLNEQYCDRSCQLACSRTLLSAGNI